MMPLRAFTVHGYRCHMAAVPPLYPQTPMFDWDWYEDRRLRLLANGVRGNVLDVGYARKPNPHFSADARVTGIDLKTAEFVPGYVEQLVGDVVDCAKLDDRFFDVVVAGEVIEHVEDPYRFLRGLRQRLQPTGTLRLSTPNPLGFPVIALELLRSKRYFYADDHTHYFLPRWVERMLERTGFREIELRPVGLWLPPIPIPWSPTSLSYQLVYSAVRS